MKFELDKGNLSRDARSVVVARLGRAPLARTELGLEAATDAALNELRPAERARADVEGRFNRCDANVRNRVGLLAHAARFQVAPRERQRRIVFVPPVPNAGHVEHRAHFKVLRRARRAARRVGVAVEGTYRIDACAPRAAAGDAEARSRRGSGRPRPPGRGRAEGGRDDASGGERRLQRYQLRGDRTDGAPRPRGGHGAVGDVKDVRGSESNCEQDSRKM